MSEASIVLPDDWYCYIVVDGCGASGSVRIGLDTPILHQINGLRSCPPTLMHLPG
jgi:hypothetical protein